MGPRTEHLALFACAALLGCPGQRRPDPRWTAPAPAPAPTPATPAPVAPVVPASSTTLEQRMGRVRELRARFEATPRETARWRELMDALEAAEEACFRAGEGAPEEAAAAERALEELTLLRDEVVRMDPGTSRE